MHPNLREARDVTGNFLGNTSELQGIIGKLRSNSKRKG